jgi:pyruvate/2-oxoacid:ferredoxin oxidoreductase alpha subunit
MPALEALRWLESEGHAVNLLQLVTMWPFPADQVSHFLATTKRWSVVEGNATGQLEGLIREQCLLAPDAHLRRSDGRPFSPEQIYAHVKQLLGEPVELTAAGALKREGM